MTDQLVFEGLTIDTATAKFKGALRVAGAGKLVIGDVVNVAIEAVVVGITHEHDKDGLLVRTHLLRPESAKLS